MIFLEVVSKVKRRFFSASEILFVVVTILAVCVFGAHLFGAFEVDGANCDTEGVWSVGILAGGDAWTGGINTSWYTSNTGALSYVLTSPDELAGLAQLVNGGNKFSGKTITLANDINLGGVPWTPIGSNIGFSGTFDGGGYDISNLYINLTTDRIGLFGVIDTSAVKNVNIVGGSITGDTRVGGVVGLAISSSSVINCSNSGSVSGGAEPAVWSGRVTVR